jgi:hypothetical protein
MAGAKAIASLKALAKKMETLPTVKRKVALKVASQYLKFIKANFAGEVDPYGKAQKPKKRPDGRKVLHGPTGMLRKFTSRPHAATGFALIPGAEYYKYLQGKRHMLPVAGKLPKTWDKAFREIASNEIKRHMKG